MSSGTPVEVSKLLSYVLRHEPQAIGLALDSEGWGRIDALIEGAASQGHTLDRELITQVVASSDKKRFEISADGRLIRAVQGHSTRSVSRVFEAKQPPPSLYHGTAARFIVAIRREGLRPTSRHYVHLSADEATAREVGQRYGSPVVLVVEAERMHTHGHVFHQAENGVWLTQMVPIEFIAVLDPHYPA